MTDEEIRTYNLWHPFIDFELPKKLGPYQLEAIWEDLNESVKSILSFGQLMDWYRTYGVEYTVYLIQNQTRRMSRIFESKSNSRIKR